ncbi:hypothetical protein BUALT_Bualt06G0012500 [Buddleja alternifolia]|uniref:Myb/SANT-like domain-containing protein n=1 Tax=Buddleja alternifolia TaxID=168488 RepID=A0AAV6XMK3_9LAMI|nr:hypothetical protein BUALT_Bualt06G0012500 [Buddleja alternifolia]
MTFLPMWNQSDFLFDEKWTHEIDNAFIDLLKNEALAGNFRVGGENTHTIDVIHWIINTKFGVAFSFLDCVRHVRKFQKRYRVFNWIAHMPGVCYDYMTNTVIGATFVWDHICKVSDQYDEGDPKRDDLEVIFGHDGETGQVFLDNIINISSGNSNNSVVHLNNQMQNVPVVDVSSGDATSHDTQFWRDLLAGNASDSASEPFDVNMGGLLFFPNRGFVETNYAPIEPPQSPPMNLSSPLDASPSSSSSNARNHLG